MQIIKKMKKILIVIFAAVFALGSCSSNQQNSSNQAKGKIVSIKGRVTQIERGKDGYTAEIITGDGKAYSAVISSVNLGSSQYREVKIGDVIEVEGEGGSGDESRITITAFK